MVSKWNNSSNSTAVPIFHLHNFAIFIWDSEMKEKEMSLVDLEMIKSKEEILSTHIKRVKNDSELQRDDLLFKIETQQATKKSYEDNHETTHEKIPALVQSSKE